MTDWSAIDAQFGRDTLPTDDPTRDDGSDQVAVAPDGGAGGWEAFDDPTPTADEPKTVDEFGDAARVRGIVEPGGRPIGEVGKAGDPRIRELPGGLAAAQELFHALSEGGIDVTPPGHPGRLLELADGGHVGFRPRTRSHSPAIDLDIPGVRVRKIHFE
jgi:hypothetical protein